MSAIDLIYGFKLPKGGINRILVLLLMMIGSFLIIPLIWWLGYVADVLNSAIKNEKDLPNFKFSRQMKLGLVVIGLEIFYLFIPFFVLGIIEFFKELSFWIDIILLAVILFILPVVISNYLTKKGAFNFSEHFSIVKKNTKGFFGVYSLFLLFEILFVFAQYTNIVNLGLLMILALLLLPYLMVVFARLYGFVYRQAK